ncbi:MAG: hypothetical protein ACOCV2_00670, partial [Persicimonas sp.]
VPPGGPPPGNQQRDEDQGDDDTKEPAGPDEARLLFVITAGLAAVVASMLAINQWFSPWMPVAIAFVLGVVGNAAIAYGYCDRQQQRALIHGVIIAALIAAPTLLWMVGPVRALAQEHLGDELTSSTHAAALEDGSSEVRKSACLNIARGHDDRLKDELLERFNTDTELARDCLATLQGDESINRDFTHRFRRGWRTSLEEGDTEKVCKVARRLYEVAAGQMNPTRELTYCATTSSDEEQAQCCADQMTERLDGPDEYVEQLGSPADVEPQRREKLFRAMVPHVYEGVDASRNELDRLERRILRHEPVERWVLALGCYIADQPGEVERTLGGLEAIGESRGCNMYERDQRERKEWQNICTRLGESEDPTGEICRSVRRDAVAATTRKAQSEVHKAIEALQSSEMAADISSTHDSLAAMAAGTKGRVDTMNKALDPNSKAMRQASPQVRRQAQILNRTSPDAKAILGQAFDVEDKDLTDKDVVQNLQLSEDTEPADGMTYDKILERLPSEERQKVEREVNRAKKELPSKYVDD